MSFSIHIRVWCRGSLESKLVSMNVVEKNFDWTWQQYVIGVWLMTPKYLILKWFIKERVENEHES